LAVAQHWEDAMELPRRTFLRLTAGAAALPAVSRIARAQAYPTRPVRIIVGYPAGGPADIGARLIGQYLSERLGQPFVVENRAGASGNIGTEAAVRAVPDGYTLLIVNPPHTVNATLYNNLSFSFLRDIVAVGMIYRQPQVLVVRPSFPAKTVAEFITYAKANPGKITMASSGSGGPQHMAGELFKRTVGLDLLHVPYRGAAPALTDLMGGQVQIMFDTLNSSIELIKSGKLRTLAVTTADRSKILPEVPAIAEFVPGYDVSSWSGIGAPKGTPNDVIGKLNNEINAGLINPKLAARFSELGVETVALSPADFGKFMAQETEKWAKVIRSANIKPD
jgi:tripartite-type tricarboxylate transporter receptor subunit TctC